MDNEKIQQELVKANITDQVIAKMRDQFMNLKVIDANDKVGFEAVSTARKEAKKFRVGVEKFLKALREPATMFQKAVVAKEKEISAKIEEIEDYLASQEEIFSPKEVVIDIPMTDDQKIELYAKTLLAVKIPVVDTEEGKKKLEGIINALRGILKDY